MPPGFRRALFFAGASGLSLLVAAPTAAQQLYGFDAPVFGQLRFGRVDMGTGAFTSIASYPDWLSTTLAALPNNPITGEYYFFGTQQNVGFTPPRTDQIVATTAAGAIRTLLPGQELLGFDVATSRIVATNVSGGVQRVVLIDPSNGTQTILASSYASAGQVFAGAANAVNSIDREIYRLSGNNLVIVDLDTGVLKRSVALSRSVAGTLAWNPVTGTLYDLTTPGVGDFRLASINTQTGTVTAISSASVANGTANSGRSLDVINGLIYIQSLGGNFRVVDINTGALVGSFSSSADAIFNQDHVVVGGSANTVFAFDVINVNAALIKVGSGTTVLTGANVHAGGTRIDAGTLQIGNGGTAGSIGGDVINNGAIVFNRSDAVVFGGVISGAGQLTKAGAGTLTLNGANTYVGPTTINGGTLSLSGGVALDNANAVTVSAGATLNIAASETIGSLAGAGSVSLGVGQTLITGGANSSTAFSGVISGIGGIEKTGAGTLVLDGSNSYSGGTTISAGTLQVGNGGTSGALGSGNVVNNAALVVNRADNITFGDVISGAGNVVQSGTGTLIVAADNSYSGGTTINAGTLQVGNGGTTGALGSGNILNNATLVFNRSDALAFAGVISGTGAVTKAGAGTLTLTGTNTYTGPTTVNGGLLAVNGSIASATTVVLGGTLGGAGTVRTTTVQSGGTLTPGNSVGTLTVSGNLALQAGSTFAAEVNPTAADRVNVTGTASVAGNLIATFQAGGGYSPASYTIINATGGISGTFASFNTVGLPGGFRTRLNYDASNVFLVLERAELVPLLGGGAVNQRSIAGGIDRAVAAGVIAPTAFAPLYNLTGTALGGALNQLDGQINAQIGEAVWNNYFSFLQLLMGEGGMGGYGASVSFAPGKSYAAADALKPAQLAPGGLTIWGTVFGGVAEVSGSAATGAAGLDSSGYRFAAGLMYAASDGLLLGTGIAAGQDNFDSGNGEARGGDFSLGLHARQSVFGSGYLSAALGFGWTSVKTARTVTISGTDVLQGKLDADTVGGRAEGGYSIALDESADLTPFTAFAAAGFETPAYGETAIGGSNAFALSYQAQGRLLAHTELGARLGRSFEWGGDPARVELVAGWMHSLNDEAISTASFQSLAGSSFQLLGVNQARNSTILGLNLKGRTGFGLDYGLKLDSRLGDGSSIVSGSGHVGWRL